MVAPVSKHTVLLTLRSGSICGLLQVFKGDILIFRVIGGLHSQVLQNTLSVFSNCPVLQLCDPLCLKHSVLAPVSLRTAHPNYANA